VTFDIALPTEDMNEADILILNALAALEEATGFTVDQIVHYPKHN